MFAIKNMNVKAVEKSLNSTLATTKRRVQGVTGKLVSRRQQPKSPALPFSCSTQDRICIQESSTCQQVSTSIYCSHYRYVNQTKYLQGIFRQFLQTFHKKTQRSHILVGFFGHFSTSGIKLLLQIINSGELHEILIDLSDSTLDEYEFSQHDYENSFCLRQ